MEYLRNCWYMVGWADEIENAAMLTRRVCDIPLVIFRTEAGVSALVDTCPHRFAPLSRGSIAAGVDRKSTRLNSSHQHRSRMPSSA